MADRFKYSEVRQKIIDAIRTDLIGPREKEEVLEEFYQICLAQQYIAEGGIGYAKELLDKALGADKAMEVIGKLTASLQVKPFEFVRKTDASQLLNFIQDEHPQTIALILSYLSAQQAALIISASLLPSPTATKGPTIWSTSLFLSITLATPSRRSSLTMPLEQCTESLMPMRSMRPAKTEVPNL